MTARSDSFALEAASTRDGSTPMAAAARPYRRITIGFVMIAVILAATGPTDYWMFGVGFAVSALALALAPDAAIGTSIVLIAAPFLFALDRYNAPILYEIPGYLQVFGLGAGAYMALTLYWGTGMARVRLYDVAFGAFFVALALSALLSPNTFAGHMFLANAAPLAVAYWAGRNLPRARLTVVLDAIVIAALAAVLGRWLQDGIGPSENIYRAATNWYLGAAVYSGSPLLIAWGLMLSHAWNPLGGRFFKKFWLKAAILVILSAELAFLQRKAFLIIMPITILLTLQLLRETRAGSAIDRIARRTNATIVAVVIIAVVLVFVTQRVETLYESFWGNTSDQFRVETITSYTDLMKDRPLGYGYGEGPKDPRSRTTIAAHNTFLDAAVNAGVVAAVALIVAVTSLSRRLWRRRSRPQTDTRDWSDWARVTVAGAALLGEVLINGPVYYREFPIPSAFITMLFVGILGTFAERAPGKATPSRSTATSTRSPVNAAAT